MNMLSQLWIRWINSEYAESIINIQSHLKTCWANYEYTKSIKNMLNQLWTCWVNYEYAESIMNMLSQLWICWVTYEFTELDCCILCKLIISACRVKIKQKKIRVCLLSTKHFLFIITRILTLCFNVIHWTCVQPCQIDIWVAGCQLSCLKKSG